MYDSMNDDLIVVLTNRSVTGSHWNEIVCGSFDVTGNQEEKKKKEIHLPSLRANSTFCLEL